MKYIGTKSLLSVVAAGMIMSTPIVASAGNSGHGNNTRVTIYFTRHAEKMTTLADAGDGHLIEVCGESKCAEELNAEGELRAELLADWFTRRGVTHQLTHAFASHKLRTRQTILPTVELAELPLTDEDANVDGIQELPAFQTELDPESTSPSVDLTISALQNLPDGSVALVAGHSGTLYAIMEGIGLEDACRPDNFPENCNQNRYPVKDDDPKIKVRDFGDIWKVVLRNNEARFVYRQNLQVNKLKTDNIAR